MKLHMNKTLLVAGLLAVETVLATDPLYINTGTVDYSQGTAPQIDAETFVNLGSFRVQTVLPMDFQNTLYFTNRGTMSGSVGFQFMRASTTEPVRPAAAFYNARKGVIRAYEGLGIYVSNTVIYPNYITIAATNVINEGYLRVANAGLMHIEGKNVNLAGSGIEVSAVEPLGGQVIAPQGYFYPDTAIYDVYWGTSNQTMNSSSLIRFFNPDYQAVSPPSEVTDYLGGVGNQAFGTYPATPFVYTNINGGYSLTLTNQNGTTTNMFVPTNIIRQVVMVGLADTNIEVRARFLQSRYSPAVTFRTACVELRSYTTNNVTEQLEESALYFTDRLASETNLVTDTNLVLASQLPTQRPNAYEVWRSMPREFANGSPDNASMDRNLVWNNTFSNVFATNFYAAYACYADSFSAQAPPVPGMGPTEQPGRVEILAENLDISKTRFRGEGLISMKAKHLVGSQGASVDAATLVYALGSTNGNLVVKDMAKQSVTRVSGYLQAWSGLWTNQTAMILSNWVVDPTIPTNYFSPITNSIDVGLHVLILGADLLVRTQQVTIYDFAAQSKNITVDDALTVTHGLVLEGETFTLNGGLNLTNDLRDLQATNYPGIQTIINNGALGVPNTAYLGWEKPLARIENRGTMQALSHYLAADNIVEEGGSIQSAVDTIIKAGSMRLEGGRDTSGGDTVIEARELKMNNQAIIASGRVNLKLTDLLTDTGGGANNTITCGDGFNLLVKPVSGDLLGTSFESSAPKFALIRHTWAGEDRGAAPEGFKNNAAIGKLSLTVAPGGALSFGPPTDDLGVPAAGNFALYVDSLVLDPSVSGSLEAALSIESGMTIYFATANVAVDSLDGKLGGRLKWVPSYAGPISGVDVAMRSAATKNILANISLVDSQTIDSDGDGIPNVADSFPFDGPTLGSVVIQSGPPAVALLSWRALGHTAYQVEMTKEILDPVVWDYLGTVSNSSPASQTVTFTNELGNDAAVASPRYYRLRGELSDILNNR